MFIKWRRFVVLCTSVSCLLVLWPMSTVGLTENHSSTTRSHLIESLPNLPSHFPERYEFHAKLPKTRQSSSMHFSMDELWRLHHRQDLHLITCPCMRIIIDDSEWHWEQDLVELITSNSLHWAHIQRWPHGTKAQHAIRERHTWQAPGYGSVGSWHISADTLCGIVTERGSGHNWQSLNPYEVNNSYDETKCRCTIPWSLWIIDRADEHIELYFLGLERRERENWQLLKLCFLK